MSVGIVVEKLKVRSLDVDYNELSWSLAPMVDDIYDYTFQVLRSEGPEGPFNPVSAEMQDEYLFVDNNIRSAHPDRTYYYCLLVRAKQSGKSEQFGPVYKTPDADLVALELRKHVNILMREFIGRRCWVFPVRTFGQRCPHCWNQPLQKRTKSGCLTCFDTGFAYGYLRPIETWASIDPTQSSEQNTNVGPLAQKDTTARLSYWPPIKNRDILIEAENLRWRVTTVSSTQQLRAPLRQELGLHLIPASDIEYKIQFDIGTALRNLWLMPARNMSNPQNLEAFTDEEFPSVMQLYGSTYPPVRS